MAFSRFCCFPRRNKAEHPQSDDLSKLYKDPAGVVTLGEFLGRGSYGQVYKGKHSQKGKVAVKVIKLTKRENSIQKEIEFLKKYSGHKNTASFYGAYYQAAPSEQECAKIWMAMEYYGGGTLYDLVQSRCGKPMSEKWIAYFCRETLKGLNSLHKHRIVHRDVKGVNIMLTDKAKVKLVDFGLCAKLDHKPDKSKDCKTLPSKCIDCRLNSDGEYDFKGDIWSLGVTAVELADGNPPLPYIPESAAIDKILTNSSKLPWSKKFQSFLEECLRYNPDHRASAKELLRHSFLQGLPPDKEIRQEIMDYLQKIQRKKLDKGAAEVEQVAEAAKPVLKKHRSNGKNNTSRMTTKSKTSGKETSSRKKHGKCKEKAAVDVKEEKHCDSA